MLSGAPQGMRVFYKPIIKWVDKIQATRSRIAVRHKQCHRQGTINGRDEVHIDNHGVSFDGMCRNP